MKTTLSTLDNNIKKIGGKNKLSTSLKKTYEMYEQMVSQGDTKMAEEIINDTAEVQKAMDVLMKQVDNLLKKDIEPAKRQSKNSPSTTGKKPIKSKRTKSGESKKRITAKLKAKAKSRAQQKPAAKPVEPQVVKRTIKSNELRVLTRFMNLPKQERSYKSIVAFASQVRNGLKKEIYGGHLTIVKQILKKINALVEAYKGTAGEVYIKIDKVDQTFMNKVVKAVNGSKERLRVSYLSGIPDPDTGK